MSTNETKDRFPRTHLRREEDIRRRTSGGAFFDRLVRTSYPLIIEGLEPKVEEDNKWYKYVERTFERLSLMKHSLLSTNYQNQNTKIGVRRLLNRLLAMIQGHTIIVVLEKREQEKDYRVLFHTMHDPLWKSMFEEKLSEIGIVEGDHIYLKHSDHQEHLHKIFDDIFLAFINVDLPINYSPSFEFIQNAILKDFFVTYFLTDFQNDKDLLYALCKSDSIAEKFKRRGEKWENGRYKIHHPDLEHKNLPIQWPSKWERKHKNWPEDFYNEHFEKISTLFDEQYQQIYDSPLLSNNLTTIPNIIFSIRMFSREKERYSGKTESEGHYLYDVRTIIPKTQQEHIRQVFKDMEKSHFKDKYFNGAHEFFWQEIKNGSKSDERIEKILEDMQSPYGYGARALSDMIFSGGFVRIATDPFPENGIYRLHKTLWDEAQRLFSGTDTYTKEEYEKFIDYRRMVYHYYMTAAMTPKGKGTEVFLAPGLVGGSPWCSLAFLINKENDDHQKWIDCFHFYHDIHQLIMHNLRNSLKRHFLKEIAELMSDLTKSLTKKHFGKRQIEDFGYNFNIRAEYLSRIYPFRLIQLIYCEPNTKGIEYELELKFNNHFFEIRLSDNPFFTKNTVYNFLNEDEVTVALQNAHQSAYEKILKNWEKENTN